MALYIFKNSVVLFLVYYLVVTTASTPTHSTAALCHDHERSALLHFKQSLSLNKSASSESSAYPKTESWKHRSDCCSWSGVECNNKTGHVIGLHLSSSLLNGTLLSNSTIFSLVHLQTLNLADNDFSNSLIPPEVVHLSSLSSLNLSLSAFYGHIPLELSKLSKLASIDLFENQLYGDFPIDIFHLPNLLVVNVSKNHGLNGFLPEFNQTSSLRGLELSQTNFSGKLPVSIGNLKSLTRLHIEGCKFFGSIPASIGNLTQLTSLSLSFNVFSKSVGLSWLGKLTKLTLLFLDDTNIHGDIPPSLANLTQLTSLSLAYNNFSGKFPMWLMNMTHLTLLQLIENELTGPIPSSFSQLKDLQTLYLQGNHLTGAVKADIFLSLKKLTNLGLSYNKITFITNHSLNFTFPKLEFLLLNSCNLSEIPYFLRFQNNLKGLYLNGNNIYGNIPHWIWNASDHMEAIDLSGNFLTAFEQNQIDLPSKSLKIVRVSANMLEGSLPVPPPNTIVYSVSNNRLTGEISPRICGGSSLKILDLSYNNMSGPIPECLANSLEALILQNNNFSGAIPQIYPKECDFRVMDLSQNQLTGKVPKSLSNCKNLQILDLSNNRLEQTFPAWLGTLQRLQVLLLNSNKFHGAIGSAIIPGEFPMLRIIDLTHNSLTGDLPLGYIQIWNAMKVLSPNVELYIHTDLKFETQNVQWTESYQNSITLKNKGLRREYNHILSIFTAVDLSSNKFTGQIPESFGSLKGLQLLGLSDNELTGPIPSSLGNLRQLESLDLSHNKLSGVIPQQLAAQLTFLEFFNVSCNRLSGRIPQGPQFRTFDNSSFEANAGLCGFPLSKDCRNVITPATDDHDHDNKLPSGFDWVFILAGVGSGLVVGFVLGNILTDRHPWLIDGIVQSFGGTRKNTRRRKRQDIRD